MTITLLSKEHGLGKPEKASPGSEIEAQKYSVILLALLFLKIIFQILQQTSDFYCQNTLRSDYPPPFVSL